MSKIFLIPGLGADTRVYNNIDLNDHEVICVDWIEPNETDTLTTYAQKIIHQYHITPKSVVIGNSLGGMIAVEIAKIIPLEKTILISSIKTVDEAPWYFSWLRAIPFYRPIPGKVFNHLEKLIKPFFGYMNPGDEWLFIDMLKNSSPTFLKWAMDAALAWDNKVVPANIYQITGEKDMVFSHKRIKNAIIVKGGTHIMIFERAKEINKLLKKILKK
jgi:pimeloyl-ACP methyl ester carboxylesterase